MENPYIRAKNTSIGFGATSSAFRQRGPSRYLERLGICAE